MMKWLVLLHVMGASVWVGGHLILTIGFLPRALRERKPSVILNFEAGYEKIGIPALVMQVITGVWMALIYVPFSQWWSLDTPHHAYLWVKLLLLLSTLVLAIHARFVLIPKLRPDGLSQLAFHIVLTTVVALLFLITGLSFRFTYL